MDYKKNVVILLLCFLLVACSSADGSNLRGRVLLWHSFDEADTLVLDKILSKFREIYPDVQVVSAAVPSDELLSRYESTAAQGLGPDLLIGANDWVGKLREDELIKDIGPNQLDTSIYLASAISSLQLSNPSGEEESVALYGLPLSLRPVALYYNTKLVRTPATTLDEWLAHAADGQQVALNTNFDEAFWGIQAFGGQLFDESGRVILDQGGFANWLNWLKKAQGEPGMILNRDDPTLRELFIEKKVAYYIGGPEILTSLQEQMGGDVAVAPLPAGPHGASGPLLRVEAMMFNPSSSKNQSKLALELAKFLSNTEQSTVLMRETGRVPANQRVRVDARAFPVIAGFATQARTAVPPSNWPQMADVRQLGNNTYTEVLQGATDLTEATLKLTNQVNEAFGFDLVQIPDETCQLGGDLQVWHKFDGSTERALAEMALRFERDCPSTTVKLTRFASEEELYNGFTDRNRDDPPPLIIGPHDWVFSLAQNEQIVPITAQIDPTMQQAYMPAALSAMRVGEELFGLPFSIDLMTLYVNTSLSNSPPTTLDELLNQARSGQTMILPTSFDEAFWGISAFADPLFDEESRPVWEEGFIEWLTWLQEAQETGSVGLSQTEGLSQTIQADLIVAPASQLEALQGSIQQIRVARLPAGPAGEARPLLHVDGFMFSEAPTALALAFARYATEAKSQERLMKRALRVPSHVNVNKEGYPAIEILFGQAQNAILLPPVLQSAPLRAENWVYDDVLVDQFDPVKSVCQFTQAIKQENGLDTSDLSPACMPDSN